MADHAALRRIEATVLRQHMLDARLAARTYTREHGEDDPQISRWTWQPNETVQHL